MWAKIGRSQVWSRTASMKARGQNWPVENYLWSIMQPELISWAEWWISWLGKEFWQKPLFIQAAKTYSSGEIVNQSYRRQVLLPDRGTENSPESVVSYCCSQYLHTAPTVENIANIKLKQLLIKRESRLIPWQKLFMILL